MLLKSLPAMADSAERKLLTLLKKATRSCYNGEVTNANLEAAKTTAATNEGVEVKEET
ncbi:MAG: hypothetical protein ACLS9T_09775 [Streptococcus salivarius]